MALFVFEPAILTANDALRKAGLPNKHSEITDVGGLPYDTVRPILMRLDNAAQLRAIEENCPHIAEYDEECWRRLIRKHFTVLDNQHQTVPRNPSSWHKVYAKYAKMAEDAKREAEAKLRAAFAGINKKKLENASTIESHTKLPRPPRDMKSVGRKEAVGRRGGSTDTGELRWTAGSRTKTTSGASVMRKVKREAAEVAARNKLATPNGRLLVRQGQIKKAPQGMVHEQANKLKPAVKVQPPAVRTKEDEAHARQMEEREARLLKLKAKGASILEDSDVDDDDADDVFGRYSGSGGSGRLNAADLEDLFDDEPPAKPQQQQKSAALPGKGRLLSNSYKGTSSAKVYKATPSASSSRQESESTTKASPQKPIARPVSPPKPAPAAVGSASGSGLKKMPMKRKAVDVFMKQKPKVQRR